MSIIDKLQKEHDILYRSHNITETESGYVCVDCKLNAWDEDFPEYCAGPISILSLNDFDTNDDVYTVTAKLFHLHNKALIEFESSTALDDGFCLDIDASDLDELIAKLQSIRDAI